MINWCQGLLEQIIKYWSCLPLTSKKNLTDQNHRKRLDLFLPIRRKNILLLRWGGYTVMNKHIITFKSGFSKTPWETFEADNVFCLWVHFKKTLATVILIRYSSMAHICTPTCCNIRAACKHSCEERMHCRHSSSPQVTEARITIMKSRFKAVNTKPTKRFVSGVQKQQVLECFWTSVWVKNGETKSCSFVPTRFHSSPCLLSL